MTQMYRITPLEKKNVEYVIEAYEANEDGSFLRGFVITERYRWGQGFREEDNIPWESEVKQGVVCDPQIGWGCELDDLCSVYVDFDGEFTEEEKEYITSLAEYELEDKDGLNGTAWVFDGDHNWNVELCDVVIHGPVMIDLVDDMNYNKVINSNINPVKAAKGSYEA